METEFEQIRKELEKNIADKLIGEPILWRKAYYEIFDSINEKSLFKDVVERWHNKKISEDMYITVYGRIYPVEKHYDIGLEINLKNKDGALLNYDSIRLFSTDIRKSMEKEGYKRFYVWSDVNLYGVKEDICIDDEIKESIEYLIDKTEQKKKEKEVYCDYVEKIAECLSVTLHEATQICNKITQNEYEILHILSKRKKVKE